MTYNPPQRLTQIERLPKIQEEDGTPKSRPSTSNGKSKKDAAKSTSIPEIVLKDLVIDGDQYFNPNGLKYQVLLENGIYVLCEEPKSPGDMVVRLSATLYHAIVSYDRTNKKYDYNHDVIPDIFHFSTRGIWMMKLSSNGILQIDIVAGTLTKHKYTYDIKTNPARYVPAE